MAVKIAFLKFKGGVSSSSATSTLAGILKEKYKVLIVDADPQNTQKTLLNVRSKALKELSMAGVLLADYDASKCLINICENVDLIQSGGKSIEQFNKRPADLSGSVIMRDRLEVLEDMYDYILIDASPTMSLIHQNILCYADYAILPTDMDILSLSATRSTIHFVEGTKTKLGEMGVKVADILGVVPMRVDSRRRVDVTILDDLESLEENELLGGGVIFKTIRDSSNMKTAQARRKFLTEVYPKSKLSADYSELANQIIERVNALKSGISPSLLASESLEVELQ